MMWRAALLALALLAPSASALQPGEALPDSAAEARARSLSAGLRCLVCQNQSIDDSDAPLARDLRRLVRERISAGDNDAAVSNYIVARYGEFVLLKPRFTERTLLLWVMPALLLVFAGLLVARQLRARPASALSSEEEARLAEALQTPSGIKKM